jgi:ABC-type sulfate transport system substrate-binding protein
VNAKNSKDNIRDDKMNYDELMEELLNNIEIFDESVDNE